MRFQTLILSAAFAALAAAGETGYKLAKKFPVPGDGGWDYITYDAVGGRLFVAHGANVDVLDAKAGKVIGQIPKTPGEHGVALVQEAGNRYISAGEINTVIEFDLKTL